MMRTLVLGTFLIFCVGVSSNALAEGRGPGARPVGADGVVQIDQKAVENGGLTAGDDPGFPAIISEPGTYRLTSNLSLVEADAGHLTDAIIITAEGVTLDLNGFEIAGYNSCTGEAPDEDVTCTYEGIFSGRGIAAQRFATIRNGSIRGMTFFGILCPLGCHVENVKVRESFAGISTGGRSIILGCVAERNGATGISTNLGRTGSTLENNTALGNGGSGFFLGNGDVARGNSSTRNSDDGFFSNGGTLVNNTASANGRDGIRILRGIVEGNSLHFNRGYGLYGLRGVGYSGNAIITGDGAAGTVTGAPVQLGQNLCGNELSASDPPNTTCP